MCDRCPAVETIDHILLRCELAHYLWAFLGLSSLANSSVSMLDFLQSARPGEPTGTFFLQPALFSFGKLLETNVFLSGHAQIVESSELPVLTLIVTLHLENKIHMAN